MGKSTKDKRDIYYRQGKAEGYRARSAYKLLHLNEQYGFLGGSEDYALDAAAASSSTSSAAPTDTSEDASRKRFPTPTRVVDLCAAPGSWSQVLSRRLASVPGSHLVAVDLQAMAPLPGVTQIIGDITTPATADAVSIALSDGPSALTADKGKGKARAQLIVCDGAPDVTGLHDLDEYLQSQLLLAATQITFRLLEVGGTFVAKIFTQHPQAGLGASLGNMDLKGARPATSGALLADQLRPFFDRVDIAKPRSSRLGSVEHFLVCLGFKPPHNLPAGIVGSLAEPTLSESTEDDAREDLVRYAQKLRSQLQRPTAASQGQAQSQQQLSATLPFVAHGDLSGFDQP